MFYMFYHTKFQKKSSGYKWIQATEIVIGVRLPGYQPADIGTGLGLWLEVCHCPLNAVLQVLLLGRTTIKVASKPNCFPTCIAVHGLVDKAWEQLGYQVWTGLQLNEEVPCCHWPNSKLLHQMHPHFDWPSDLPQMCTIAFARCCLLLFITDGGIKDWQGQGLKGFWLSNALMHCHQSPRCVLEWLANDEQIHHFGLTTSFALQWNRQHSPLKAAGLTGRQKLKLHLSLHLAVHWQHADADQIHGLMNCIDQNSKLTKLITLITVNCIAIKPNGATHVTEQPVPIIWQGLTRNWGVVPCNTASSSRQLTDMCCTFLLQDSLCIIEKLHNFCLPGLLESDMINTAVSYTQWCSMLCPEMQCIASRNAGLSIEFKW